MPCPGYGIECEHRTAYRRLVCTLSLCAHVFGPRLASDGVSGAPRFQARHCLFLYYKSFFCITNFHSKRPNGVYVHNDGLCLSSALAMLINTAGVC